MPFSWRQSQAFVGRRPTATGRRTQSLQSLTQASIAADSPHFSCKVPLPIFLRMSLYAGYSQSRFTFDPGRTKVWLEIADYLARYFPEDGSILDLGSGYCDFINAARAREKWAVDLHLDPEKHARKGVRCLRTDVADLSAVPDASLDLVFASNLLEHLDDDKLGATLSQVNSKLRPGGRFIAIQPNYAHCYRQYFDDYTHVKVFSHVSLPDFLASQGLEVERVTPRFLPFSMKSRWPKLSFFVWIYLRLPYRPLAKQMLVVARKPNP